MKSNAVPTSSGESVAVQIVSADEVKPLTDVLRRVARRVPERRRAEQPEASAEPLFRLWLGQSG